MTQRWQIKADGTLIPTGNYSIGDGAGNDPFNIRLENDLTVGGVITPAEAESLGIGVPPSAVAHLALAGGSGGKAGINFANSSPMPTPLDGDLWYDTTLRFRHNALTRAFAYERRQRKENSNAPFSLTWLTDEEIIRHTGTLSADRAVTINTAGVPPGATFRITRTGGNSGGTWNLNVSGSSGGVLKAMATMQWGDFTYGATDGAWYLAASGNVVP